MRSLFAKIFLAFFLTVVLLGALLELTAVRTERRRIDTVFRPLAERLAPDVAGAYEAGGADGLSAALGRLLLTAALFDDHGAPIGHVPNALATAGPLLSQRTSGSNEPLMTFELWGGIALQPTVGPSGRRYVLAVVLPHERWLAILNTLDEYPAIRLTAVGLVAGLICWLLAGHITRPLVGLRATASRMAEGQLDARAGPTIAARRDEIGALGRDFDHMADRLSVLVAAERRLLADVSHELRSPLARLTVALGLARQHAADASVPDRTERLVVELDRIDREAARIDRMLGQSLTLARIDSGVEAGPRERFDLTDLVQQVAADGDYEARAIGRRVHMHTADACTMTGVAELVRSAVENVVRNAIRYTAEGTEVVVDLHRAEGQPPQARIEVRDRGPGIPESQLSAVFLPFHRGDPAPGPTTGAGLGLAIADRVMRMHGGRIAAANATGGGLIVQMSLPVDQASAAHAMGGARE